MKLSRCIQPNFRTFVMVLCILYLGMLFVFQSGLEFKRDYYASENKITLVKNVKEKENAEKPEHIPPVVDCQGPKANVEFKFHQLITNLYLFSGYWDSRPNDFDNKDNRTYIRIMSALITRSKTGQEITYCVFKIEGKSNQFMSPAKYYEMCENHNRRFGGFILSCLVPEEITQPPCSVTVQSTVGSGESKVVRIPVYNTDQRPNPHRFGLCLSPLFGKVKANTFIEFMELSAILGVQKVTLYDMEQNADISHILAHYEREGMLNIVPWRLPSIVDSKIWYHGQLVAIQDCLYRNMGSVDFVAFNDLDEFIMPREIFDWEDLIKAIHKDTHCGYSFKSAFFDHRQESTYNGDYSFLFTAVRNQRTKTFSKFRTKNMVIPRKVFEKGIHHISKPILSHLEVQLVEPDAAFLHHYRACMTGYGMNCRTFMTDNHVIDTYPELSHKVQHVFDLLNVRPS